MRPTNTLKSLLVHPKDKKDIEQCIWYSMQNCDKSHIGETGRPFETRLKEHQKDTQQVANKKFYRTTMENQHLNSTNLVLLTTLRKKTMLSIAKTVKE